MVFLGLEVVFWAHDVLATLVMLRALRGAQEDHSEHFLSLFVTHFSIFFRFLSHVRHLNLQEVVNAHIKYCKKMAERKLF